jgi:hypothetical protein
MHLIAGGIILALGTLFALVMGYMSEQDEQERHRSAGQM